MTKKADLVFLCASFVSFVVRDWRRISDAPLRTSVLTNQNSKFVNRNLSYLQSHVARRAFNLPDRSLNIVAVQVRHLLARDLLNLLRRDLADFIFIGRARPFRNSSRTLQQYRGGRRFGD